MEALKNSIRPEALREFRRAERAAGIRKPSKYMPHQGKREKERRARQDAKIAERKTLETA